MPNPCASGVSRPKSGVATSIVVDQQFVQALLPPSLAWLYPYLPWMTGLEIGNVATFCAANPPTFTLPSATDFFDFVSSSAIGRTSTVLEFIQSITKYYLWWRLCECNTGTPAAPSAPPSAPSNLPVVNPPDIARPAPNSGDPCALVFSTGTWIPAYDGTPVFTEHVPGTALRFDWTAHSNPAGSVHSAITFDVNWHSVGAADYPDGLLKSTNYPLASGGTVTVTEDVPVGARTVAVITHAPGFDLSDLFEFDGEIFCTPPLAAPQPIPCPPDPMVRQLLKQIYELLTLVQRQAAPFAYVYGTNHTGLTGDGSFSVFGLIGVSVDVTTLPDSYGRADGTPVEFFDLGYVTLGTADGYSTSRRIDHDGTLLVPTLGGLFTLIGYTLAPGVAVSIRELVREP